MFVFTLTYMANNYKYNIHTVLIFCMLFSILSSCLHYELLHWILEFHRTSFTLFIWYVQTDNHPWFSYKKKKNSVSERIIQNAKIGKDFQDFHACIVWIDCIPNWTILQFCNETCHHRNVWMIMIEIYSLFLKIFVNFDVNKI